MNEKHGLPYFHRSNFLFAVSGQDGSIPQKINWFTYGVTGPSEKINWFTYDVTGPSEKIIWFTYGVTGPSEKIIWFTYGVTDPSEKINCFTYGVTGPCEPFNRIDAIKHAVIAYYADEPVGCGAIREYSPDTVEIKRMFCKENQRKKGIASMILDELERWAKELGFTRCILETGEKLPEAINLYQKKGYSRIANYGQYECLGSSVCFEKNLGNVDEKAFRQLPADKELLRLN
jgi:N-acetylglutamate synthase-like GNAT family acetyltransferase